MFCLIATFGDLLIMMGQDGYPLREVFHMMLTMRRGFIRNYEKSCMDVDYWLP
jgi:hypothetical protein